MQSFLPDWARQNGYTCISYQCIAGVGEEDLYLDYEISFMSEAGCRDFKDETKPNDFIFSSFASLYNYIDRYAESGTLSERTEQFMLDLGITAEEIAVIKSIMLEEYSITE